jgi:hypothetical protein
MDNPTLKDSYTLAELDLYMKTLTPDQQDELYQQLSLIEQAMLKDWCEMGNLD